jgi:hypothetical protein
MKVTTVTSRLIAVGILFLAGAAAAQDKPNILVIWGDDIGQSNISAYTMGLVGYEMYGRSLVLYLRAKRIPHRPFQGRLTWC